MEKEKQTLEQRAKAAAKDQKSQAWKVAVVSALGLTVGATGTYAAIHPTHDEKEEEQNQKEDAISSTSKHTTSKVASHTTDHDDSSHSVSIPKYVVYDQETVILPNGSQAQVACGVTDRHTDCVLVDNDMDGKANLFFEDINHDGQIENCEITDLAKNDIAISMEHLPSVDIITIVESEPEQIAYVVEEDPAVIVDGSDDVINAEINPEKEMSDITDSYGLASTGDMTTDDGTDNFMA